MFRTYFQASLIPPAIKAYLTIDDGPSPDRPILLAALAQAGVTAVFFSEGAKLEQYPELALATIRAGHVLANHSFTHPHFSDISVEEAKIEIARTDDLIESLYRQAGLSRPAKLFRFPYGDTGDGRQGMVFKWWLRRDQRKYAALQAFLRVLGYEHLPVSGGLPNWYENLSRSADTHWTFDVMEWSLTQARPIWQLNSLQTIQSRINQQHPRDIRGLPFWKKRWLGGDDRSQIILMHDQVGLGQHFAILLAQLREKVDIQSPLN